MIHYYKKNTNHLKFDESTMIYEAIKIEGDFVSYLKNTITDDYKDIVIRGFSERNDELSTESQFNTIKQIALSLINN